MNYKILFVICIISILLWFLFRNKFTEDFQDSQQSKIIVYLFKADFCGHCKAFMPEFVKFQTTVKEKNLPVDIKIIDDKDTDSENIIKENNINIEGYPTVIFIKDKINTIYEGPRTEEGLMNKLNELL